MYIRHKDRIETFAWDCVYKPVKDYYKDSWILGGNAAAEAMARDSIKQPYNN